ncbi:MAG: 1-propanol dehydrogenase PduQ [Anaerobacillus sp.]|uniref:1-propanol dehydrogenase PduQ n=1 Tax=Anaerobacillus sp. TaxID=1872506 RepID=UPI003919CA62
MQKFAIPTAVYSGSGSLEQLSVIKNNHIWIVCDRFLVENKAVTKLLKHIDDTNMVDIFPDVVPDPPLENVARGVEVAIQLKPQILLAFGGGSAIDTAKGILLFLKKSGSNPIKKFIAIPTTSGTGSEVTAATVLTDRKSKVKYPIFTEEIIPDEAILDPELVVSVPPTITANTGMDVLTHALEAYVSKNANSFTDALAEKSFQLAIENLVDCYKNGANIASRTKVHDASTLAGMAFNSSNLGLNHSIAHQIGAKFHIPHGLANALLLKPVAQFNAKASPYALKKYAHLARISRISEAEDDDEALVDLTNLFERLMVAMKMPLTLSECDIQKSSIQKELDTMCTAVLTDACFATNPVQPTKDEIKAIILSVI